MEWVWNLANHFAYLPLASWEIANGMAVIWTEALG
jgi:hypothetical protein